MKIDSNVILVYPIRDRVRQNTQLLEKPDSLFRWHNDSLLIVLNGFNVDAKGMVSVKYFYNLKLFRKSE